MQPAAPVSALNLSTQAQQTLRLQIFETLIAQLVTQVQSGAQAAAWPTSGVAPALRELLSALIAQASLPQPQQLVAAQAWPQAWLNALLPAAASAALSAASGNGAAAGTVGGAGTASPATTAAANASSVAPRLPPMLTWLVQQGVVQTPEGERGFALTLQVPQAWAQLQASAALPAGVASPAAALLPAAGPVQLKLPFAAPAQQLESGALALVLQGAGPGGEKLRTSALLWLDFQPLPSAAQSAQSAATGLAGLLPSTQVAQQALAALQAKNDPWLQMAALQASGQQPREGLPERKTGLCTELGCPYRGKASCAQPFCAEMNRVWAAARIGPAAT